MAHSLSQALTLVAASSQFAYRADDPDIVGDITLEGWVKFTSLPTDGNAMRFVTKDDFGAQRTYGFNFQDPAGGGANYALRFRWFVSGANGEASADWTPTIGTWYHVALTRQSSSGDIKFYVNGIQQGSTAASNTGNLLNTTADFMIGAGGSNTAPANMLNGKMSLWRAWTVVRTQTEIAAAMCNVIGSLTGLEAEYTLNGVYTDNTGNGNTLTAGNSPTFTVDTPALCAAVAGGMLPLLGVG